MAVNPDRFRLAWIGPMQMMEFGEFLYTEAKKNPNKVVKAFSKRPKEYAILALRHTGRIVGYMIYRWKSAQVTINKLFVLEGFRRQGGGSLMVEMLTQTYVGMKAKPVCVKVSGDNLPAQKFFRKHSFVGVPEGDDYVFTFMDKPKTNMTVKDQV